jgi:hypothetical protein
MINVWEMRLFQFQAEETRRRRGGDHHGETPPDTGRDIVTGKAEPGTAAGD